MQRGGGTAVPLQSLPYWNKPASIYKREGGDGGVRVRHADVGLASWEASGVSLPVRGNSGRSQAPLSTKSRAVKLGGKLQRFVGFCCSDKLLEVGLFGDRRIIQRPNLQDHLWHGLGASPASSEGCWGCTKRCPPARSRTQTVFCYVLCTHRQAAGSSQKCRSEMPTTFRLLSRETKPQPAHREMFRRRILFPMALFWFFQSQPYS